MSLADRQVSRRLALMTMGAGVLAAAVGAVARNTSRAEATPTAAESNAEALPQGIPHDTLVGLL